MTFVWEQQSLRHKEMLRVLRTITTEGFSFISKYLMLHGVFRHYISLKVSKVSVNKNQFLQNLSVVTSIET